MNRYSPFLLAPIAVALATSAPAQQSNDLSAVVGHMQAVQTMSATFTQTDRTGHSVTGKLLLKRPGHVRFEYQKGVPLLIVADGKALTMVDYEVKQVQRWPIRNSPLAALLDPGKDLSRFGKRMPTDNPNVISVQVRDPKRPEYGTMTMIFIRQASAPGGWTLNGWVALDSKNNRTTVRLDNVRYNMPIAQSSFTWRDPRPRRKS
ncbi:MAG: outer membrane lipoprotein carrier protein LolA [Sphingomonadales bacterium]|nr:outer membrane lipoprotein carrier protein LolA [Sphingomonadales bacterium]